jgi:hypothetical protein
MKQHKNEGDPKLPVKIEISQYTYHMGKIEEVYLVIATLVSTYPITLHNQG